MNFKRNPKTDFKDIDKLSKNEAQEEIKDLREGIEYHNRKYYVENAPVISDKTYDKLFRRLQDLENAFPEFRSKDSPTQKVGTEPVEELKKVRHASPMLSLNAVMEDKEVKNFLDNVGPDSTFIVEPKFDGFSVEIVYENSRFKTGSTRGDGIEGEEISHNLRQIKSLPQNLKGNNIPNLLVLRAEVLMSKSGFQDLNKERIEQGREAFATARNAASGMMRQLDPKKVKGDIFRIVFYEILKIEGHEINSHWERLQKLSNWGLIIDEHNKKVNSYEEIKNFHKKIAAEREKLDYEIDGIVIKVDDINLREKLGTRERSPKWALAWKFEPKKEVTRIKDIVVQVGRTGMLTPVALLEPVEVGGVTVSRATLHNEDEIHKKDIRRGDKVRVIRAGDVIPEVMEQIPEKGRKRSAEFNMPDNCPSCGAKIYREGAYYLCPNGLSCRAQLIGKIFHYASQEAMDIEGLGEETVRELVDREMVKNIADLYELAKDDFMELEGFSDKSSENLHKAIHKYKEVEIDRFLYALGIHHIGRHIARVLVKNYDNWKALTKAGKQELLQINEIGPEIADSFREFFDEEENNNTIQRIFDAGIELKPLKTKESKALKDKTIVFTGELDEFTRDEAKSEAEKFGAHASSSVSNNTDFIVAGKNPGSKLNEAKKHNVKILNEQEFKELLKK